MAKDRRTDSTKPTRNALGRRGGSSIKKEKDYIRETKASLRGEQALLDDAKRHRLGTPNPWTRKESRREHALLVVLEMLALYESAAPLAAHLRELSVVAAAELVVGAGRCRTVPHSLIPHLRDGDVVLTAWCYFYSQPGSKEVGESLLLASTAMDPFYEILAARPLHRFRELAIVELGLAGYFYQEVADLVDEGDRDRTRKSRAWGIVVAEYKRQGKRPPKKPRIRRDQGDQPDHARA